MYSYAGAAWVMDGAGTACLAPQTGQNWAFSVGKPLPQEMQYMSITFQI
jgi:hypothetical protein